MMSKSTQLLVTGLAAFIAAMGINASGGLAVLRGLFLGLAIVLLIGSVAVGRREDRAEKD